MWNSNDNRPPQPTVPSFAESQPTTSARVAAPKPQPSMIGKSLVFKGEIAGSEPLYIDGCVEGSINLPAHRVTVGREGNVKAEINAREVVVMGNVCGNLNVSDRVEIRSDGSVSGDVVVHRISIEDGAFFQGAIEVRKGSDKSNGVAQTEPRLALEPIEDTSAAEPDLDGWAEASFAVAD